MLTLRRTCLLLCCLTCLTSCETARAVLAQTPTLPDDPPASVMDCLPEPPIPPRAVLEKDGPLASQTIADITLAGRDCRNAVKGFAKWWRDVKALYAKKKEAGLGRPT